MMSDQYLPPSSETATAMIEWAVPLPGVRAGSALVQVGDRLLLAQDDDHTLVWVTVDGESVNCTHAPLHEKSGPQTKAAKPDFEAATMLPDGRVLVIGSGSAPPRRTVVLLHPETGDFELRDAGRLYDLVTAALGHTPNLEGVVWIDGGVRLFHRGHAEQTNAVVDMTIDPDDTAHAAIRSVQRWDIGTVPGASGPVALTVTDAETDSHGRDWFLAAAEDTPNAIDDGPVVGAAIGHRSPTGDSAMALIMEADGTPCARKAEGLVLTPDLRTAWLVTDPDDEELNAELCRVRLEGWPP